MNYATTTQNFNNVNMSVLNSIPNTFDKFFKNNHDDKRTNDLFETLKIKIEDLKDISSMYENPDFQTHLKIKELTMEIAHIKKLITKVA